METRSTDGTGTGRAGRHTCPPSAAAGVFVSLIEDVARTQAGLAAAGGGPAGCCTGFRSRQVLSGEPVPVRERAGVEVLADGLDPETKRRFASGVMVRAGPGRPAGWPDRAGPAPATATAARASGCLCPGGRPVAIAASAGSGGRLPWIRPSWCRTRTATADRAVSWIRRASRLSTVRCSFCLQHDYPGRATGR